MSEYYHRFARFVDEPREGETLREFVERECFDRAKMVEQMIEELPEGKDYLLDIDSALYGAMPVNFYVYTSNYSVQKHGFDAPPIVADRMGGKTASDEEYSYFGTLDGFLHHIADPNYPWIGELEYPDWEICPPDLITYNNYDYSGGDLDDDEEEEE